VAVNLDLDPPVSLAGDRLFATMHGLHWLCVNLASDSPLAIIVDDVQWADDQSQLWLSYLVRRLSDVGAVIVLGVRAEAGDPLSTPLESIVDEPSATTLAPAPLSRFGVSEFVANVTGLSAPPEVVAACHAQTAGNPFVLRELVHSVSDQGLRFDDPATAELIGTVVPESVARSILRRLAAQMPAVRALAQAIAILSMDVTLADATRLAGLSSAAGASALDALVRAGFILPISPLQFVHPLMREVIYADVPLGRRRVMHRDAAELLSARIAPESIGAHLLECDASGDQNSVALLRRCAARAMASGAPAAASRYLQRALEEGPTIDVRGALLRELGTAEARLGRPEALTHLEEAASSPVSVDEACAATRELALAVASKGAMDEAARILDRGVTALADTDREQSLLLLGELAAFGQLDVTWTRRVAERLAQVGPTLQGRSPGERLVLASYAYARSNEDADTAEIALLAERALHDGALLDEQTADAPAFYLNIYALFRADRPDDADRWLTAALDDARQRGSLLGMSIGMAVRGQLRWLRGQLLDAEADARVSMDAQLEAGWASVLPLTAHVIGECLLERGEPAAALEVFAGSGLLGPMPEMHMFRWAQATRGRIRIASGEVDQGIADLEDAERESMGTRTGLGLLWRSDVAVALARGGRRERARELAAEQLALTGAAGVPHFHGVALRTLGMVSDGVEARGLLGESVAVLEPTYARLDLARTFVELGAHLRRDGSPAAAREPLQRGYELALACGSMVLAAQAAAELAAAGVRMRRQSINGVDSLTPSERRVAEMAASGMSNPEIAQTLFLTRKTIEMHLGRAYRKLAIAGRAELAGALH
jgi:DNA-binding CsgD family transcriptional regulator